MEIARAGCLVVDVLRRRETARVHLRRTYNTETHFVVRMTDENRYCSFRQGIKTVNTSTSTEATLTM